MTESATHRLGENSRLLNFMGLLSATISLGVTYAKKSGGLPHSQVAMSTKPHTKTVTLGSVRLRQTRARSFSPSLLQSGSGKSPMPDHAVTQLLNDWGHGDRSALERLMPLVYSELRRVAQNQLRLENPGHTLQPTALVHETYLRLVDQQRMEWQNRSQFFAISAQLIRRVLIDHARHRRAGKRGGLSLKLELNSSLAAPQPDVVDALALDHVLEELAGLDPQQGRVVELRFFAGLSIEETAMALGISEATVSRDWVTARAWLYRRLNTSAALAGA